MKKEIIPAIIISILLLAAVSDTLSELNLYRTVVKGDDSISHPNTLFEIPNELRVEFYAASNEVPKFYNDSEPSTPNYPFGEIVYLMLIRTRLRDGENPPIANITIIVSDYMGNVVWRRCIGPWGGGEGVSGGSGGLGVPWVPDAIGNYTAGVIFEGLIYDVPSDYSNVISIEICRSSIIFGKVTEKDGLTAICTALVEVLVDGVQKKSTITDSKGAYTLPLKPESVYDIQASAPGYIPAIWRNVSTELEAKSLNFSLEPIEDPEPQQQTPAKPDLNATLKATSAFIRLEPSVAEINQPVRVNMFVEPPPPTSSEVFQGLTVTIAGPDGRVYVTGPYLTDSNGTQHMFFTPVQTGNYTLQLHFPGQLFGGGEVEYAAATSLMVTLTVNVQPAVLSDPDDVSPEQSPVLNPRPSQEALSKPNGQQSDGTALVSVFASIGSIIAVSTVSPIYFKKRKR